jgi:AcrR family transcriptional regulator
MAKKSPIETKEKLLQAAAQIVIASGNTQFTLEQVAQIANVSKGGLLHHFPTKLELLSGLMTQLTQTFEVRLQAALELEPKRKRGRFARAYIRASFEPEADELELTNALANVIVHFPELIDQLRQEFAFIEKQFSKDGLIEARATLIRLACDGLWFSELLGVEVIEEPRRSNLLKELMELTI